MKSQDMPLPVSFKVFLGGLAAIFAGAVVMLIIAATSAATTTGSAPALAVALVDGPNTGIIGPRGQRWFRLTLSQQAQTAALEQAFTLIFTPDDGQRVRQVNLQIFDEDQLPMFYFGDTSGMANLGAGQIVSRDNNPVTGELFWTGWLLDQKNYYVQVSNGNDTPLDYWLFTDNVINYPLGDTDAAPALPIQPVVPEIGADPGNPLPLPPGANQGTLKPGLTRWYSFTHNDLSNPNQFQNLNFTLFFSPADGNRQHQVNFKLFPAQAVEMWRRGQTSQLINFGAGMLVSRDGDSLTGEQVWNGTVIRGETYLLAVENGTDTPIDYWLFDSDRDHIEPVP